MSELNLTAADTKPAPKSRLNDIHVNAEEVLITPNALREALPLPEAGRVFVKNARQIIANIIHKQDHRLLVIAGPCSVHDVEAAKAYARQLKKLHDKYQDSLYIVMRVYFEKPRTTIGWKGLINDPHMDGSFDVESGLRKARELLIYLTELFMGINRLGQVALIKTSGNPDGHVILRGGQKPNYDAVNVALCEQELAKQNLEPGIVVDCSHGNSNKDYRRQPIVADNVFDQICAGNKTIIGIMLESNINAGNQSSELPFEQLQYGVSVTDACIDFETTEQLISAASAKLEVVLKQRINPSTIA